MWHGLVIYCWESGRADNKGILALTSKPSHGSVLNGLCAEVGPQPSSRLPEVASPCTPKASNRFHQAGVKESRFTSIWGRFRKNKRTIRPSNAGDLWFWIGTP